jgi:UDP-GlcNAc:undecaprenyl-phosphate/decaprenyl-phosphate GlcNAc-1-phosphate transferase
MLDVLLSITLSFLITLFTLPVVIIIANQKNLFDIPNERKIHTSPIASIGGFAIFTGFIFMSWIFVRFADALDFQYFLAAVLVIFFIRLKDDILVDVLVGSDKPISSYAKQNRLLLLNQ